MLSQLGVTVHMKGFADIQTAPLSRDFMVPLSTGVAAGREFGKWAWSSSGWASAWGWRCKTCGLVDQW